MINISHSHATSPAPIIGAGEMEREEQLSNNYWNKRNGMGGETVRVFSRVGQSISPLIIVIRYEHLKIRISNGQYAQAFHNQPLFSWSELTEDQTKLK